MVQSSRNKTTTTATTTTTNRVLPLLLLLLLAKLPIAVTAATTTTSSALAGDCSTLFSECFETDLCVACLTTIEGVGVDSASGTSVQEEGSAATCTVYEFEDDSLCDRLGVSYCCSAELSGEDCFTDGATLDYWECLLGSNGCDMQDMPCISELTASGSDEDEVITSDRDIEGAASSSANDADAEGNGVPKARGGGGSWVGQVAGALGLVVSVASMVV